MTAQPYGFLVAPSDSMFAAGNGANRGNGRYWSDQTGSAYQFPGDRIGFFEHIILGREMAQAIQDHALAAKFNAVLAELG